MIEEEHIIVHKTTKTDERNLRSKRLQTSKEENIFNKKPRNFSGYIPCPTPNDVSGHHDHFIDRSEIDLV